MSITRIKAEGTSKFIDEIFYDDGSRHLTFIFVDSPNKATRYINVPETVFQGFVTCEDLGRYFNANIYGAYSHTNIDVKDIHRGDANGPSNSKL